MKSLAKFSLIGLSLLILSAGIYYIFTQPEEVYAADWTEACTATLVSGCEYVGPYDCTAGECSIDACPSRGNATSTNNCGVTTCTAARFYCTPCTPSGTCDYTCDSGYYNCDGNNTNGCEADSICNDPPTFSDNSTNSTTAGELIEHREKWVDDNSLSGCIFSWHNGTNISESCSGSATACSNHATQSPCETCGCTWGSVEAWINNTPTSFTDTAGDTVQETNAYDNNTDTSSQTLFANGDDDPSVTFHTFGGNDTEYKTITLCMEYYDTSTAGDDQYQISWSNDSATTWYVWVAWTTGGQSKTVICKDMIASNTNQLQVKIAMDRVGGGDGDYLNISQIWANSTYDDYSCSGAPDSCAVGTCNSTCGCTYTGEQEYANNTFTNVTNSWINVTKRANATAGIIHKWKNYCNDSDNQWNTSSHEYNTTAAVGDTCDCSSIQGGTSIDCSENCDIDTCDVGGIDVTFINTGTIVTIGDVTNIANTYFSSGCTLVIGQSKRWG